MLCCKCPEQEFFTNTEVGQGKNAGIQHSVFFPTTFVPFHANFYKRLAIKLYCLYTQRV